jgi:hypothetical protein
MVILSSFANKHFKKGFPRLLAQACEFNVFDEIQFYSEKDLNKSFRKSFSKLLRPYSRGFGYWCWKPQIIYQILSKMNDGDILLYMDLGSHLNIGGKKRLMDYLDCVDKSRIGILAFRSPVHLEKKLTKMDVFRHFNVEENKYYTDTTQIEATHIFIRKCKTSVDFITEWLAVLYDNSDLFTDSNSKFAEFAEFEAHRHDQSVFSILAKKYCIETLSTDETYSENWDTMNSYPLLAKRDKVLNHWWQSKYYGRIGKLSKIIWRL